MKINNINTNNFPNYLIEKFGLEDGLRMLDTYCDLMDLCEQQPFCSHKKKLVLSSGDEIELFIEPHYYA